MDEKEKEAVKTVLICLLNSTFPAEMHEARDRLLQEVADLYEVDFDHERDRYIPS